MVGSSQTDLPSVTDPRTWESTHRILSPIRPHGLERHFCPFLEASGFAADFGTFSQCKDAIPCGMPSPHSRERLYSRFRSGPMQHSKVDEGSATRQDCAQDQPSSEPCSPAQMLVPSPIRFTRATCGALRESERREWWIANGLGGYAGGTVAGHGAC